MPQRLIDVTGQRFGSVLVLRRSGASGGQALWLCSCDCGREFRVSSSPLRHGSTRSCGKCQIVGELKRCSGCRVPKSVSEFHKARVGALGVTAVCKDCRAARAGAHYQQNRARLIQAGREYRELAADKVNAKNRLRIKRQAAQRVAATRERRSVEPEKYRARRAVQSALRNGTLSRPDSCSWCRRRGARIVAHHGQGYDKPNWLNVEWICQRCHQRHHAAEAAA